VVLYTAVAPVVLAAWSLLLTATAVTQPLLAPASVGAGAHIYQLQQIFPPAIVQSPLEGRQVGDFTVTEGSNEQHAPITGMSRQIREQIDACRVRPMEVVEHKRHRATLGDGHHEAGDRPEEPLLIL